MMNRLSSKQRLTAATPLVLATTMALALSGCMSLAPKYQRPAAPVAASFPDAPASTADARAASQIAWQTYFADARLNQLINLALVNNRDLRVAILNIEQARAAYQIRRADILPSVSLAATGERTPGANDSITSVYSVGLGVSAYELDLFGRVKNLSDVALAQFLATAEARNSTQISLISSVANTYLSLLADDELLELTKQTLAGREDSLRLIQLKYDNGVVSKLDLQQGVSLVETARVVLAQQVRQRALDANLLIQLVGQPLPATLPPSRTLAQTELGELPAGLPSDLLAVRPDIRSAEQQLIAANANIGAARANFFPRISLTASAGSASGELSGLFKSGSWGWTFAPQAVLPIFDYGRNKANLASARVGNDIAVANYEKAIQVAFREVSDSLAGQATFAEQLRAQRRVADAEADRFSLSDLRYKSGASSYLELLDAQRALFDAQRSAISANLLRLQNQVTLYRVLGGGWVQTQGQTQAQTQAQATAQR